MTQRRITVFTSLDSKAGYSKRTNSSMSPIFEHLTVVYTVRYHTDSERERERERERETEFPCKIKWHKQVLVSLYTVQFS
jgi:hypothetical protein